MCCPQIQREDTAHGTMRSAAVRQGCDPGEMHGSAMLLIHMGCQDGQILWDWQLTLGGLVITSTR